MFKKNFKYLKKSLTILTAAIMISSTPVSINYAKTTPNNVDYYETDNNWARLLQHSLFFYDANMCGSDVKKIIFYLGVEIVMYMTHNFLSTLKTQI